MKNIKKLLLFVLLLTMALLICACDNSNGGNGSETTKPDPKTYEYSFNIGESNLKYVLEVQPTGTGLEDYTVSAHLNGKNLGVVETGSDAKGFTQVNICGATFEMTEDGKLVYISGNVYSLIPSYDMVAGEYSLEGTDCTISLTADGKAVSSANPEAANNYYPIDFNHAIVIVEGQNTGLIFEIKDDNTIWESQGTAYNVATESLSTYYELFFSAEKKYEGAGGYFFGSRLYIKDNKCAIVGSFFLVIDCTVQDTLIVTDQGHFNITGDFFDYIFNTKFTFDGKTIKTYDDIGRVYFSGNSDIAEGIYQTVYTGSAMGIGGAFYSNEADTVYVLDEELNLAYTVSGQKFIDRNLYNQYPSPKYSAQFYFNDDLSAGYQMEEISDKPHLIPIVIKNKLCDSLVVDENDILYALLDGKLVDTNHAANFGNIDMFLSPDSCTLVCLDYVYEDNIEENSNVFIIKKDSDIIYLFAFENNTVLYSTMYYGITEFGDIVTDGTYFIKTTDTKMEVMSLNRYEILISSDDEVTVNDFDNGYITVTNGTINYLVNKNTLTLDHCFDDPNYSDSVNYIDMSGDTYVVNVMEQKIYVNMRNVYNSQVEVLSPFNLRAVNLVDGLYKYDVTYDSGETILDNYVFIWNAGTRFYYYSVSWNGNWEKDNASAPDDVQSLLNIMNESDIYFGLGSMHLSICRYGDMAEMYLYISHSDNVGDPITIVFYSSVIYGAYEYDADTDTITITTADYIYKITNAKGTDYLQSTCLYREAVADSQ